MISFMNSPLLEFGKEKICWSLQHSFSNCPIIKRGKREHRNILNLAQLWFMSSLAFGADFVTGFVSTGHVCNFEGNFLRVLTFTALTFAFKYICNSSCTKLWNFTYLEKTNLFEHCTASSSVKSIINHENKCNTEGMKDQRSTHKYGRTLGIVNLGADSQGMLETFLSVYVFIKTCSLCYISKNTSSFKIEIASEL